MKQSHETVASKLELDLSMQYMKKRQFEEAVGVLKAFERKDPSLRAMAATNLSFIYFLEEELELANKHADAAVKADRYNAKALVNKV
jgi:intraflagellar transport protein 88